MEEITKFTYKEVKEKVFDKIREIYSEEPNTVNIDNNYSEDPNFKERYYKLGGVDYHFFKIRIEVYDEHGGNQYSNTDKILESLWYQYKGQDKFIPITNLDNAVIAFKVALDIYKQTEQKLGEKTVYLLKFDPNNLTQAKIFIGDKYQLKTINEYNGDTTYIIIRNEYPFSSSIIVEKGDTITKLNNYTLIIKDKLI